MGALDKIRAFLYSLYGTIPEDADERIQAAFGEPVEQEAGTDAAWWLLGAGLLVAAVALMIAN